MEKAFQRLIYEVRSSGDLMDQFLPFDMTEALGAALTFSAISRMIGQEVGFRSFGYRVSQIIARDGVLTMKGLEIESEPQRKALGVQHGHLVFRGMIEQLYEPFERWVELDRKNKGGAQPKFFRNLVIERLAESSEDIIGKRATSTAKGPFSDLCTRVLNALGISSKGLEKAIPPILTKLKEKAAQ